MKQILMSAILFSASASVEAQNLPVYLDESKPVEQRIDDALSRMTLDEKIAVIHAQSKFSSPGVKRLGFPSRKVERYKYTDMQQLFAPDYGLNLNRLRIGMHMQACPTAVFATRKFSARRVTKAMTNYPSPYNTYINPGLPPGPIRVTPAQVIDSTLHATKSKYLYMCANPDFSGTHVFSESYTKHAATARLYQRELNKRKIRK